MLLVRGLILTIFALFFSNHLFAQKKYVDADGIIEYHNRIPLHGATLKLFDGDKLIETVKTGVSGEYHFKLEYNKEYTLEISKNRLVTKLVKYNTNMPPKIKGAWWIGIPINLYEVCPGIDASVFGNPVAIVEFNEKRKEYRANPQHDDLMRKRIRSFEQKNDACLEGEFIKLVRNADELYDQKKYEEAKKLYEEAEEKRPWEVYAIERLEEIENKLAKQEASANVFENMVTHGDRLFDSGNLIAAKNAYKRALAINQSDTYARDKIAEIDKTLKQDATEQQQQIAANNQYEQIISQADNALQANNLSLAERFYTQALELKPSESYPKTQLSKIKTQLAKEQLKQQEIQKLREEYNKKIAAADAYFSQKKYEDAKSSYIAAQQTLPGETYPSQKLKEIDGIVQENQLLAQKHAKEKEEQEFNNLLIKADGAYDGGDYQAAKIDYERALAIKPFDNYTKQRFAKVEKLIAAKENQQRENELAYNKSLNAGNLFFAQKKYDLAKNEYNKAVALKPDEVLPKTQIIKINQLLKEEEKQKQTEQEKEIEYRMAISTGEKFKSQRDFIAAKTSFQKALTIKPNDPLAQSKLKEIDGLEQQQQQLAAQQEIDAQYQEAILEGNQLIVREDYTGAKLKFQSASSLKPNETLPKNKLLQIQRIEEEKERTLALEKTRETAYQKAINEAGKALASKDYFSARSLYNQALKYKSGDALATSKIEEINSTLERQKQEQQALAEKDRKYNELVGSADKLFDAKDYIRAKSTYNMALALKKESYPEAQIQKIDKLLVLQEQEKQAALEREKNYAQAVNKANDLYNKKDYYNAKEMYEAALKIRPDDDYSKTKVKNISALLQKLEASRTSTTTQTVAVKAQNSKMLPELKFNDDSELELYLAELKEIYPEGISHEIYKEDRAVMDRYIIIRQNETNEYRKVHYSWGGTEFWINDKPCTSMYFNSQTKQRPGEYYNKVNK